MEIQERLYTAQLVRKNVHKLALRWKQHTGASIYVLHVYFPAFFPDSSSPTDGVHRKVL